MKKTIILLLFFSITQIYSQRKIDTIEENKKALSIFYFLQDKSSSSSLKQYPIKQYVKILNDSIANLFIKLSNKSYNNNDTLTFLSSSLILADNNIKINLQPEIFKLFISQKLSNSKNYLYRKYSLEILKETKTSKKQTNQLIDAIKLIRKSNPKVTSEFINSFKKIIDYKNISNVQRKELSQINPLTKNDKLYLIKNYDNFKELFSAKDFRFDNDYESNMNFDIHFINNKTIPS